MNLDSIVTVEPAVAVNTGTQDQVSELNPLSVTALNAVNVDLGNGVDLLGGNALLDLGAVNQVAVANSDGSSLGASGAVTDDGGIGVGGAGVPTANATLDLQPLIATVPALGPILSDGTLTVGSVAAAATQAAGAGGAQTGDYAIAGLTLDLTSPLVAAIQSDLQATLASLQPVLDALPATLDPLAPAAVTLDGVPDLAAFAATLSTVSAAGGAVTVDLTTGVVSADVAGLLAASGLDVNELPEGTSLVPFITDALTSDLAPALTAELSALTDQIAEAITGIQATVAGVPVDAADEVTSDLAPALTAELSALTDQIAEAITGIQATVAGVPVDAGLLAGVLADAADEVTSPVEADIAALGDDVVAPLALGIDRLVAITANNQTTAGGTFTQNALQLVLLPADGLAVVDLASASVGPNAGPLAVPTATGIDPGNGPASGGTTVTLTGTGFVPGATSVAIGGATVPAGEVAVAADGTSLTFTTPAHGAGPVEVTATTPDGTSGAQTFTYDPITGPAPDTTGIDPDRGPAAGGTTVTLTGTGFVPGETSVNIGGVGVPADAVTVAADGTSLTFTTPAHGAGVVDVTATTPGGISDPQTFTYDPVPTSATIDPPRGPVTGGTTVTVTGTGFVPGATSVTIGGTTVAAATVSPGGTSLTFVTPAHAPGAVDVTVATPGGVSGAQSFTYVPVPTVTGIDPGNGPATGGTVVTVTGTGFVPGETSVAIGGTTVPADAVTVTPDGTSLTFLTPSGEPGPVDVSVSTPVGTSGTVPFTYDPVTTPAPVIADIDPGTGPSAGGTAVTVTGSGFVPGSTTVTIGDTIVPASVSSDGSSLTFVTPPHAAGVVDVSVTTPGGTATVPFTYEAPAGPAAPVITAPPGGSTVPTEGVVVVGTGQPGSTVTVSEGTMVLCTVGVDDFGGWACDVSGLLGVGDHTITARQTDQDGNPSPASAPITFTVSDAALPVNGGGGSFPYGSGGSDGDDQGGTGYDRMGTSYPAGSGNSSAGGTGGLAYTGAHLGAPLGLGVLLTLVGGLMVATRRRRRA